MLPFILSGWAWVLARERERLHAVMRLAWPAWIALAIYVALRTQTAAMTPMTAPDAYRFVLAPGALAANALEYLDRACTFSAAVVIVAHLIAWRRPTMTPAITRVLPLAAIWFAGTFALTIFVPTRSSLYALLPSIAPALVAGFLLQALWMSRPRSPIGAWLSPLSFLPRCWCPCTGRAIRAGSKSRSSRRRRSASSSRSCASAPRPGDSCFATTGARGARSPTPMTSCCRRRYAWRPGATSEPRWRTPRPGEPMPRESCSRMVESGWISRSLTICSDTLQGPPASSGTISN